MGRKPGQQQSVSCEGYNRVDLCKKGWGLGVAETTGPTMKYLKTWTKSQRCSSKFLTFIPSTKMVSIRLSLGKKKRYRGRSLIQKSKIRNAPNSETFEH
jgi:hypothetical protein